jgi:hypothetical protein
LTSFTKNDQFVYEDAHLRNCGIERNRHFDRERDTNANIHANLEQDSGDTFPLDNIKGMAMNDTFTASIFS